MAQESMETEEASSDEIKIDQIVDHLILSKNVYFRSQQKDEVELTATEKRDIAMKIFTNSKSFFLSRFGKNLKEEHLTYFKRYTSDEKEGYEIDFYLTSLKRFFTKRNRSTDVKNRRYDALKKLIDDDNYFTEREMMKRNPLLYEQLVGQYLSEDERKKRDNIDTKNITFVNLLLEGIDRDFIKQKQKQQQQDEDAVEEEEDDDEDDAESNDEAKVDTEMDEYENWDENICTQTKWGEFENESNETQSDFKTQFPLLSKNVDIPKKKEIVMITASERRLLKEEFISIMYQNFLDGKDTEFDYAAVDNNDDYDNIELKTHDAEDTYFDSESPENMPEEDVNMQSKSDTSEDELDVFMQSLNQHHSIQQLTKDVNNL